MLASLPFLLLSNILFHLRLLLEITLDRVNHASVMVNKIVGGETFPSAIGLVSDPVCLMRLQLGLCDFRGNRFKPLHFKWLRLI